MLHDISSSSYIEENVFKSMHDSLLAYVCFQHASCSLYWMKQAILQCMYVVALCPWFIYGYVVRRLDNNNNVKLPIYAMRHRNQMLLAISWQHTANSRQ